MTAHGDSEPMLPTGDPRPLIEILKDFEPDVDDDPEMAEVSLEAFFEDMAEGFGYDVSGEDCRFTLADIVDAIREDRGE